MWLGMCMRGHVIGYVYERGYVIGYVYEIHVIGVCVQERMCM